MSPIISEKDVKDVEMIDLEEKPYQEWMKSLAVFSLEMGVKGNIISVYSFLTRGKRRSRL